jgi:hypothetical protein
MKLTIHILLDPRAGFKQVHCTEIYIWIGNNTGIQNFMDCLEIFSTYLPHFPPMKGEVFKELSSTESYYLV